MTEMFFILMTIIALEPAAATKGEAEVRIGDVLESTLLGASETEANCREGAALLAQPVQAAGQDAVLVHVDCVQLPVEAGISQGFTDIKDVPLKSNLEGN